MEISVTSVLVLCPRYWFNHCSHKDKLQHRRIDLYNGKSSLTSSFHFLQAKQNKLHKQILNLLLSLHVDSLQSPTGVRKSKSSLEVASNANTSKVPAGIWKNARS
jgi:hypothetical protein